MGSFAEKIINDPALRGRGRPLRADPAAGPSGPICPLFPGNWAQGKINHVYKIVRAFKQGGMSRNYEVRDHSGRSFILKMADFTPYQNDQALFVELWKRFRREVRILHGIYHTDLLSADLVEHRSNVVELVDWDPQWDPKDPDRAFPRYIIEEFVQGKDLSEALTPGRPIDPLNALKITYSLLVGLIVFGDVAGKLYPASIVDGRPIQIAHRDLKPENLLLQMEGNKVTRVVLIDFGIMKVVADHEETLTRTGDFRGTPHWSAPETVPNRSRNADQRSDIYVASAMLYNMLTGREPFNYNDIQEQVLFYTDPAKHISKLRDESRREAFVSPELWDVVFRGMAADPNERFQTYSEAAIAVYDMLLRHAG